MATRPLKTFRLSYVRVDKDLGAYLQVLGSPSEVKLGATPSSFISVRDDGLTLSPGIGNNINIQAMPQNIKYGGLLQDLPFPMSILPVTPFTPFPQQIISPPLGKIVPLLADFSLILSALVL